MLTHLSVRNVVLIDKLDLDFGAGLTVLTGETGAGKSILLDALSLALGVRAETALIRHGEKEAGVTVCFTLPENHPVCALLRERGYGYTGDLILRRTVSADGRSRAFVNDEPVSISFLKSIGDLLVEIHGQFASHRLLDPATHLETLDAYGLLADSVNSCRQAYELWQDKKKQRSVAEQEILSAQREEEFLRTSVADLEKLDPQPDEEETLTQRRTSLMNSEKIVSALNAAYAILADEDSGCSHLLGSALTQIERADEWSENALADVTGQVSQAVALIEDAVSGIERETENWGDVSELPMIDDRLFALRDAARKHHVSIAELPDLLGKLKQQITQLETGEDALVVLRHGEEKARLAYIGLAETLSGLRKQVAARLDRAVMDELPALKLGKATFKTDIARLSESEWTATGMDKVAFLVATNKGTPLAPIHKVASGGELARFMLALKVNLTTGDNGNTFIFDEVDSGVGGATADAVGARLKQLSRQHQVLVVTHSPQVAAYGDFHLTVHKEEREAAVITSVSPLTGIDRQDEIARMLSGSAITGTARTMAQELLEICSKR